MRKCTLLFFILLCILSLATLISCDNEEIKETITVTFNSDGGTAIECQEIISGEFINEPTPPTKDGYTFEGWYLGDKVWDFSGAIKKNITLKAMWSPIEYTITYINGNCELEKFSPLQEYNLYDYTSWTNDENYSIEGWYLDKELTKPITKIESNTNSNLTLYGKVSPLKLMIINNECTVVSCAVDAVCATVPDTYNGYTVTTIAPKAFYGCVSLENVTLPSTIRTIGASAFEGCILLESINLPSSIEKIGANAFSGCLSLKSIEIPKEITNIHPYTFYGCLNLTSVKLLGDKVSYISSNAFYGCILLEKIDLSRGVKAINDRAFEDCFSLKYVLLGSECHYASSSAFENCYFVTVYHMLSEPPHENWSLGVGESTATVVWGYNPSESDIDWN